MRCRPSRAWWLSVVGRCNHLIVATAHNPTGLPGFWAVVIT